MKIKMYQVFKVLEIYKRVKELKVPARVAYKFNKLCAKLSEDANFYDEEVNKIVNQYGVREEDGSFKRTPEGAIQIQDGQLITAQRAVDELLNLDIEATDIEFTMEELDELRLSIEDFNTMLPFLKE